MQLFEKGGIGIALFLFVAIIGLLLFNGPGMPSHTTSTTTVTPTPTLQILHQVLITQPVQPGQKTLQAIPFTVETTYAPTPTDTTGTGNPTGNVLSDYANMLLFAIQHACPFPATFPSTNFVIVNAADSGCLYNMTTIPNFIITKLHTSATSEFADQYCTKHLQCVGFADAVAAGAGIPLPPVGAAGDYATTYAPGYTWHPQGGYDIQVGDIAVWNTHVAIVMKVYPDKSFGVAEANGCDNPGISTGGSVGIETVPNQNATPYGNYNLNYHYWGYLRKK